MFSCSEEMFAYVRFRDDNKKVVLPVSDIKNFEPKGVNEYEKSKWYDVFWDDEKHCGYYLAQIVKLFATKQDAEEGLKKRIRIPVRPLDDGDSDCESRASSDDSFRKEQGKKNETRAKCKVAAAEFRKQQRHLLFGDSSEENDVPPQRQEARKIPVDRRPKDLQVKRKQKDFPDVAVEDEGTQAENARLREENRKLRAENAELSRSNKMLMKALCSKVFDAEKRIFGVPAGTPVNTINTEHSAAPVSPDVPPIRAVVATLPPAKTAQHAQPPPAPEREQGLYAATEGKVYLGSDVYITEGAYTRLMRLKSDSKFVREAAVAIFSIEGLICRSVTGAKSNRTKGDAKPAIDNAKYLILAEFFSHYLENSCPAGEVAKRKKELNRFLAVKISDLSKNPKDKTQNEDLPETVGETEK